MRKKYMDNIRWITVVLVVLYHVVYMFNSCGVLGGIGPLAQMQYQDVLLYVLYPWFMLLLFVVSGMSARLYLDRHSHREFVKARTVKLLVPSTIGLFVFWWILGYYNMRIGGAMESMGAVPAPIRYLIMAVSGIGPLWYIQMLWLFSVLLVGFRKIEKDRLYGLCKRTPVLVLILLTPVIWGASLILNTPLVLVYRFGIYGVGFLLGYLILSQDEVMDRLEKWWLPLLVAAAVLAVWFTASYYGQNYAGHEVLDTPLCNGYAWIATLAALAVMKRWGDRENNFSVWMTQKSWGLYLFHYLPLAMASCYLYPVQLPAFGKYLCVAVAAFGGAVVLYEVVSRIPVLRWCVCGISGGRRRGQAEKEVKSGN